MGFFDIALGFTLVVTSVVADGGGFRGDEHRNNNAEIGLAKRGLDASFSDNKVKDATFAGAGKFSGPEHGSLHGSAGGLGHGRKTNNDIGGSFGDQHGAAGQFGNVGGRHGGDVKGIGHGFDGVDSGDGFKGDFVGRITQIHNVHGGQNFGGVIGHGNGGLKGGFGGGITQGHNVHGNAHGTRSTFAGSHGAGHGDGPLLIHGGIGGDFGRHDNIQASFGGELSNSGKSGHEKSGDHHNEIKGGESFGNIGNLRKNVKFEGGNEHFGSDIQSHGHRSSLGFNSGSDFGSEDKFGGRGAVIKGSVDHGSIDHQTEHIASSGSGSRYGGIIGEGTIGDSGSLFRESLIHVGYRRDNLNSDVNGGSLHDFGGGDAFGGVHGGKENSFDHPGNDGGNIGGFGSGPIHGDLRSSIGHGGKGGDSFGGFGSSIVHGGKEDVGSFRNFGNNPIHEGKEDGSGFGSFGSSIGHERGNVDGGSFAVLSSSPVHGGHGGASVGAFQGSIVHGGKGDGGSFSGFGSSLVDGGKGVGSFGGFSSIAHGGKEDGGSFGSFGGKIGHGRGFDFGGLGQQAVVGGLGGGNFFGYKEEDFLPGKDADFTGGLAGGFGGNPFHGHGASVVSHDGQDARVGHSALGSFGDALSGRGGGQGGDIFSSGFIGSSAGGHRGVLNHDGAVSSSIKAGHGGGFQSFDGADHLSIFGGDIRGGDFSGPDGVEGGKFDGPGVSVHGEQHQQFSYGKTGGFVVGAKGGFGDDKSQAAKFRGVFDVHGGGPGGGNVGGHGKEKLVTHQPGNPHGINGSN